MKTPLPLRFSAASAVLAALFLTGCHHALVVKVDLYNPKLRQWELEQKKSEKTAVCPPLTQKEERVLAALKNYREENPPPRVPEPYPHSDLIRVADQVSAHEALAQTLADILQTELERERVRPARSALEAALIRLRNVLAEAVVSNAADKLTREIEAAEKEAAAAQKSLAPDQARAPFRPSTPQFVISAELSTEEVARLHDALLAACKSVREARDSLAKTRDEVAQTHQQLGQTWRDLARNTRDALGQTRLAYQQDLATVSPIPPLGHDKDAMRRAEIERVYRDTVHRHLEDFVHDFWTVLQNPALQPVGYLDLRLPAPESLQSIYRLPRGVQPLVRQFIPPELMTEGNGPKLASLIEALNLAPPAPLQKSDRFDVVLSDPLIALASTDPEGWQSTPSFVRHDTNSKSDLLIVRETPAQFHAVALRETPSTTVDASMRLAVATTAVVIEVAQTVAGMNLGFSPPAGGLPDSPDTATAEGLGVKVSPWTAANLRAVARARAERVQSLLRRVPTDTNQSSPAWQAWNAEAKALLASHPRIEASPPAKGAN